MNNRPTLTNDKGAVEFDLAPGTYSIGLVSLRGYASVTASDAIVLKDGEYRQLDAIALAAEGSLSGIVIDQDDKPVAGALVEALIVRPFSRTTDGSVRQATTDAQGRYRIGALKAGAYYLRVSSRSSKAADLSIFTVYFPNSEELAQASATRVEPGRELAHIDFRVRRTEKLHISGRVAGFSGKTQNVEIYSCLPGDNQGSVTYARIESDGTFDALVDPGPYCVDYRERADNNIQAFDRVTVRATDRDVTNLRLRPVIPKVLTGIIKLEPGSSLQMPPSVYLRPLGQAVLTPPSKVASDGTFSVPGILPLDYEVNVGTRDGYVRSIRLDALNLPDFQFNGATLAGNLTIELALGKGRLKGKVDLRSNSSARVLVALRPTGPQSDRNELQRRTGVSPQGDFSFQNLPAGTYKVLAVDLPFATGNDIFDFFPSTPVRISDAEEPNIEVRLITRSEIEDAAARH